MKKSVSLLASLLLLLPLLTLAAEPRKTLAAKSIDSKKTLPNSVETKPTQIGPVIPGYVPIKDVKAKHIQYLGKFAVHEHNKKTGDSLRYLEVRSGQKQITVPGTNYKLQIETAIEGLQFSYEAFIFESLNGILHLKSFVEIVIPGGYFRIKDVKRPFIQGLGKFAVDDHNIQKRDNLKFIEVYEGASQVVAGVNYNLLLRAARGSLVFHYEAVVYVDLKNIRHLTSFVLRIHI